MADQAPSGSQRPRSPSDALMIRRGSDAAGTASGSNSPIGLTDQRSGSYGSPLPGHRRIISAPARQLLTTPSPNPDDADALALVPYRADAEDTADTTQVGEYELDTQTIALVIRRTRVTDNNNNNDNDKKYYDSLAELEKHINYKGEKMCGYPNGCIYIAEARQQGVQIPMRKVISHIFGRNKTCTRSVPEPVWYCVCRKHYQRSRYRSGDGFSLQLCQYVMTQALRIQVWSNDNARRGTPEDGILIDWNLACRRREQTRRDGKGDGNTKRKFKGDEDNDDIDEEEDDNIGDLDIQYSSTNNGVSVPDWLFEKTGRTYSTLQLIEIVHQIHDYIIANNLGGFPDVEFLPNITGANAKPKPKAKTKSKAGKAKARPSAISSGRDARDSRSRLLTRAQHYDEEDEEDEYEPRVKRQRNSIAEDTYPARSTRTVPYFGDNGRTAPIVSPLQPVYRGSYHQRSVSDVIGVSNPNWPARQLPVSAQYNYPSGPAQPYTHYLSNNNNNCSNGMGTSSCQYGHSSAADLDNGYRAMQRRDYSSAYRQPETLGYLNTGYTYGGGNPSRSYMSGGLASGGSAKHNRHLSTPSLIGGSSGAGSYYTAGSQYAPRQGQGMLPTNYSSIPPHPGTGYNDPPPPPPSLRATEESSRRDEPVARY